ncbi:MAG TPA: hypothetical protein VD706_00900 [Candidatus Saccharimonadales bacterium]|nr:hypothetical protein [Candidatus Saccharimonadales bacterium]
MSGISREQLYAAAFSIVENPEGHNFDRRPEIAFDLGREPVAITSAYTTGDPNDPPFKQIGLLREGTPLFQSAAVANVMGELATQHLPHVPDQGMKVVCAELQEAAEEMAPRSSENEFEMIALHALYEVHGRHIPHTFISNGFVDILSKKVPSPTYTDEDLRETYAVQAEHDDTIEPFDEWAAAFQEIREAAGSEEQLKRTYAENYLNWLVVPRIYMHPVVRSSLFERETA